MEATKAVIALQGKRIEIGEADVATLNNMLAHCPVGGSYSDDKIDPNKRMALVPTLTIEVQVTTLAK
jgi:hypothetical protein